MLEPNEQSIIEIINFINNNTLTVLEYETVFMHLIDIYFELGQYDIVIQEGIKYHKSRPQDKNYPSLEPLYKNIIKASMQVKSFDTAYQYINYRKNVLPIADRYFSDLDIIEFKRKTNQNYIPEIENLIKESIPQTIKLYLLKDLMNLYIEKDEPNKAITLINELKKLDNEHSYIPNYLTVLLKLGNIEEAKSIASSYRNHPKYEMASFKTLLKIYIKENDDHKIAILDADFSQKIEGESYEFRKEVYELFIKYYQSIKNKYQLENYTKKLKSLEKEIKKTNKKNEDTIDKQEVKIVDHTKPINEIVKPKENIYQMDVLIELFSYAHQLSHTLSYREYLRLLFIHIDKYVKTSDYIIFKSKDEMLYHYKKERLYDKQLARSTYSNTIIESILNEGNDLFGEPKSFKYDKNILTLKEFSDDVGYIYAFPLYDLGVFIVYLDKKVDDPGTYYDLFKGIAAICYASMKDEEKLSELKLETNFLRNIMGSSLNNIRIQYEHHADYNKSAQVLLNVDSHLPFELFLRNLAVHEIKNYEKAYARLYEKAGQMDIITYLYLNKQIREKMISLKDKDEIVIISVFEDITEIHEERSRLIEEATVDFETSLQNLNALNNHLVDYVKDKGSFLLISFNESILPIYGNEVTLKFFKEFGQRTQKFFEEGTVYRYATYELFVYLPINDIRSVTKSIKSYLKYLVEKESLVIPYETYEPKIAVIRYPVVTEEKLPHKLFRFLELSLDNLKRNYPEDDYIFYEHQIYESEMFEQQVINYLNQAIEANQLSLNFHQIIDLSRNVIWQYESEIILENIEIDSKYLLAIAKKRNRLKALEYDHIKMVCQFLNVLEKETGKLIKITIPISKETFFDINFNPYIFGIFHEYGIPLEFIRFKVKGDNLKTNQYINQINELTSSGIGLDTTNVDSALSYPFNALHLDFKKADPKWYDYIKVMHDLFSNHQMALVVRDVETIDQKESLLNLGIKYIQGNIYKSITADKLYLRIKESLPHEN
ncbi:EAL domain-containing protein [Acholeplasma granularum]|uniref:EAL domain-containing protein n=1 Tax=Acholeplasma granularum TaxID=264635 RepID=UPI00138AE674|nr:EAL domain-containing protein [Acholeplasma granularum]